MPVECALFKHGCVVITECLIKKMEHDITHEMTLYVSALDCGEIRGSNRSHELCEAPPEEPRNNVCEQE